MQVGDEIAVFEGVVVPFCLRAIGGGSEGRNKLVGPAYLHGIMRGGL